MLCIHHIKSGGKLEVLLENLGGNERADIESLHLGALHNSLTVNVVDAGHIGGVLGSAVD